MEHSTTKSIPSSTTYERWIRLARLWDSGFHHLHSKDVSFFTILKQQLQQANPDENNSANRSRFRKAGSFERPSFGLEDATVSLTVFGVSTVFLRRVDMFMSILVQPFPKIDRLFIGWNPRSG